jgi:hypothetical protein
MAHKFGHFVAIPIVVFSAGHALSQSDDDNSDYISALSQYADFLIAGRCGEPPSRTRWAVLAQVSRCVLAKGGISKTVVQNTDLSPGAFGPQCVQIFSRTSRVCLTNGTVGIVKLNVSGRQGIGGPPTYAIAADDQRCIDVTTQLQADHFGNYPNYHCTTGASVALEVIILPKSVSPE